MIRAVSERPILFSAPMVRAILDGRKTQTRRIVKPQPDVRTNGSWSWDTGRKRGHICSGGTHWTPDAIAFHSPYGLPAFGDYGADRLWVRETWGINHFEYCRPNPIPKARPADVRDDQLVYFATEDDCEVLAEMPQTPSIHMPRWASRILLEITEVRVERLQDISEADALAEGVETEWCCGVPTDACGTHIGGCCGQPESVDPVVAYGALWADINGSASWLANPWVWAVSFRRVEQQARAA